MPRQQIPSPSDLKAILHSKRANLYYLEHCRVMQKDGRVLYLTEGNLYPIPIANTTCLLLGTGTSITQAAMRLLSTAGVLVGFCGGGGTPLHMAAEVEWLTPQSEYRPTAYLQAWLSFWFDDAVRLEAAKYLQQQRITYLKQVWSNRHLAADGFLNDALDSAFAKHENGLVGANSINELLTNEGRLAKALYKQAAHCLDYGDFKRDSDASDSANQFLNHGNYLAYGLAATTCWTLGIPHGFALMHGKTRRGALVFDIADLIKDAIVLPYAFISAKDNATEQQFRQQCLLSLTQHKALDFMFNTVKTIAEKYSAVKGDLADDG